MERERERKRKKNRNNYFKHQRQSATRTSEYERANAFARFCPRERNERLPRTQWDMVRARASARTHGCAFTQLLDITALGIGNSASSLPINA